MHRKGFPKHGAGKRCLWLPKEADVSRPSMGRKEGHGGVLEVWGGGEPSCSHPTLWLLLVKNTDIPAAEGRG